MTASDDNVVVAEYQAPVSDAPSRLEALRAQILSVLHLHRWLIGLVALYWAGCAVVFLFAWHTVFTGRELLFWLSIITSATFCFFTVSLLVWLASWLLPRKYSGALRDQIKAQSTYPRLLLAVPVFLLYCPFAAAFAKFKLLIPTFHPFAFDVALAHIDRALHAGVDPWRWLAPVFLNAPGIEIISLLYNLAWMGVMFYVLTHVSLNTRVLHRMQFLYSFFGCWILLGTFGALALISAGPVFYERVVGHPGPYGALFSQLAQFRAQGWFTPAPSSNALWHAYATPGIKYIALGISAMPSMHISVTLLIFLYARRFGTVLAWAAGLYLMLIVIGSIILGWHYAVDGYAALIGTTVIWWVAGKLTRRLHPSSRIAA